MRLHADAVTQNGPAAERAGGIDGDDADGLASIAIGARDLIGQGALAGAGRAGQAEQERVPAVGKERLQQCGRFRRVVFDGGDGPRQGTNVTVAYALGKFRDVVIRSQFSTAETQRHRDTETPRIKNQSGIFFENLRSEDGNRPWFSSVSPCLCG